jgi:hypothetical protein
MEDLVIEASTVYDLSITRDYVSSWGIAAAVRELLQNAIDNPYGVEIDCSSTSLSLTNPRGELSKQSLLLGISTKQNDSSTIGQFGEGYKLALLVLLRNNVDVRILNNGVLWVPVFKHCPKFESEILAIAETPDPDSEGCGISVQIGHIPRQVMQKIKDNTLILQDSLGPLIETSKGRILREHPGRLYVNGLFVCKTDLHFGYDIKPEFLKLDRDRGMASSIDVKFLAKDMWYEGGQPNEIAMLLRNKCPDLTYGQYSLTPAVAEACWEIFEGEHPDSIITDSEDEAAGYRKQGQEKVFVYSEAFSSAVQRSPRYTVPEKVIAISPEEQMQAFYDEWVANDCDLPSGMSQAFELLLKESCRWRVA